MIKAQGIIPIRSFITPQKCHLGFSSHPFLTKRNIYRELWTRQTNLGHNDLKCQMLPLYHKGIVLLLNFPVVSTEMVKQSYDGICIS